MHQIKVFCGKLKSSYDVIPIVTHKKQDSSHVTKQDHNNFENSANVFPTLLNLNLNLFISLRRNTLKKNYNTVKKCI